MRFAVLSIVLAFAGCAAPVRVIGGRHVAIETHEVGAVRMVSFVNAKRSVVGANAGADFAMVLPGGDWLATVNAVLVRLSPDGRAVRWSLEGIGVWDAVAAGPERVIAVGELADPAALNGAARAVFAIDTVRGRIAWRAEAPAITSGARARVARVGSTTVAASAYGEAAVDDEGRVVWQHAHPPTDDPFVVPIDRGSERGRDGGVLVLTTPQRMASDDVGGAPRHAPLIARTLALATGEERGHAELLADGDFIALGEIGFSADGRVVALVGDVRVTVQPWTSPEGERSMAQAQVPTPKLVEIDAHDLVAPALRARAMPVATTRGATAIAPSEVAFVGRYATDGEPLGVTVVDLATGRARRLPIASTEKEHTYIQFVQLTARAGEISFAGQFTGDAAPLHGRVEIVDSCEAQRGIECFGGESDVTLAPTAAVIGVLRPR